ncbi:hypothetical protein GW17_00006195 [Ensete ventricosum]|nr:hypothetical protein GW17_00006195 [Ensete ventricosum]
MATSEVVLEEYAEELRIREGGGGRDTLPPQGRSGDLQRVPRAFDRRSGDVLRLLHHRLQTEFVSSSSSLQASINSPGDNHLNNWFPLFQGDKPKDKPL